MKLIDILSVLPRVPYSSVSEFPMLDFFIFRANDRVKSSTQVRNEIK